MTPLKRTVLVPQLTLSGTGSGTALRYVPVSLACAVPGCGIRLWKRNASGVCRKHNHAAGLCRCADCRRAAE